MGKFKKEILYIVFLVLLCGLSAYGVNFIFAHEEGEKTPQTIRFGEGDFYQGYIEINAHVLHIDPVSSRISVEMEFVPHGRFDAGDGFLGEPLLLFTDSVSLARFDFPAGEKIHPLELTFDFYKGEAADYPFDEYQAMLELRVTNEESAAVPIEFNLHAYHHNFALSAQALPIDSHGNLVFDLGVKRSLLIKNTAIFWMLTIWALTLVNIAVFVGVLTERVKADFGLFGYMSGFIVAVYFFRQMFPEIPPFLGVYSDFASIFWSILVAASIATVVAAKWLIYLFKKEDGEPDSIV
ncbi:MAG: hypothetical protein Fur002_23080 [Anaerolineales bacterium]